MHLGTSSCNAMMMSISATWLIASFDLVLHRMNLPHDMFQHRLKCIGIWVPTILWQVVQKHKCLHPKNVARELRSQKHQRPKNKHREEYGKQSSHTFPAPSLLPPYFIYFLGEIYKLWNPVMFEWAIRIIMKAFGAWNNHDYHTFL